MRRQALGNWILWVALVVVCPSGDVPKVLRIMNFALSCHESPCAELLLLESHLVGRLLAFLALERVADSWVLL